MQNLGQSPATIKMFKYNYDFTICYKIKNDKDDLQGLNNSVLAPGQSRICMLDYQKINQEVCFTLKYQSASKKIYSESFTIDLKAGVSLPYGKVSTERKEILQKIYKS